MAEVGLHDLMRDAGDGAGNDQADVGSDHVRAGPRDVPRQQRAANAGPDRARADPHRRRQLRRLRELRPADRQDAADGVPACNTVPVMQAARGASLSPSDPRTPRPARTGRSSRPRSRCLLLFAAVAAVAYAFDVVTRSWPSPTSRPPAGARGRRLLHPHLTRNPGAAFSTGDVVHRGAHRDRDRRWRAVVVWVAPAG